MAIEVQCAKCQASFTTSASNYGNLCEECDGTNEAKRKESARWFRLTPSQRIEELRKRVEALEQSSQWDGRIG